MILSTDQFLFHLSYLQRRWCCFFLVLHKAEEDFLLLPWQVLRR